MEKDLINLAPVFYGITVVPEQHWQTYGYALLTIAGADGEVSAPEMEWLTHDLAEAAHVPKETIASWENFDYSNGDLSALFSQMSSSTFINFAKVLIYDAIRISSADHDFSDMERRKVSEAARILKITQDEIHMIEALIDVEKAAEKLRAMIF